MNSQIEVREANAEDWPRLQPFFKRIYRAGHPLHRFDFWNWQYGSAEFGRSFIVTDGQAVYGHLGANLSDNIAWVINVYLDVELRSKGFIRALYGLARSYLPVAATNINAPGLAMYRSMNYIRYCDLQRYVLIRPGLDARQAVRSATTREFGRPAVDHHYWAQPGINGGSTEDGSTFALQTNVGGARLVNIIDPRQMTQELWEAGLNWCDFVTSWNDPLCKVLEAQGWTPGDPIPYRLDPMIEGSRANIAFVSETPMPKGFIVKRYHSDHGRVPSLPDLNK